jgi:putative heme transporter
VAIEPVGPLTGELPQVSPDDTGGPPRPRRRPFRFSLKLLFAFGVLYFAVIPQIPGFRDAVERLRNVNPVLLGVGLGLEVAALVCYSLLTRATLGEAGAGLSVARLFRIQMSSKALSSIVPGGSAAGPALAYRLMTLSGVNGPDAGFALATAGVGSAVLLNAVLWFGLIISVPLRGVNRGYGLAAVIGILIMAFAAALVFALMEGQTRAERVLRWLARKMHLSEDRAGAAVRQIGGRLEDLVADRRLLGRVFMWGMANWLLDAAALWVFLRAYGGSLGIDALMISFGLANIAAVVPITPGGLGIVEGIYIPSLVGFGLTSAQASLGVATYRLAQYFFPIVLGAVLYGSLRVGPWSIHRRERLRRLRDLAADSESNPETALDFAARFGRRPPPINVRGTLHPAEGDGNDDQGPGDHHS